MSLGGELAGFVAGLIETAVGMPAAQREAELANIRRELRAGIERLDAIEPNLPRIHELGEKRRAEIEEEERQRRQDEPTSKVEVPR